MAALRDLIAFAPPPTTQDESRGLSVAHVLLGRAYGKLNLSNLACEEYVTALDLDRQNQEATQQLANNIATRAGRLNPHAARRIQALLEKRPDLFRQSPRS